MIMSMTVEDMQKEQLVKGFQELCNGYTKKTENIRTYCKSWGSGISTVPENIRNNIGCIVSLIQDQINKGLFCTKDQCLMIYNFQISIDESPFYVLEMLIKPTSKEEVDLSTLTDGKAFQLAVDEAGNIFNNTYFLEQLELLDEALAKLDPPTCYGNYHEYEQVAIATTRKAGAPITFGFNFAVLKARHQYEVPSPTSPTSPISPFLYSMGESPPSDFKSSVLLDCRA